MSARRSSNRAGSSSTKQQSPGSRRDFLKHSSLAATGAVAGNLAISRMAYAAGDDTLRIGLIGCGGRGTGAAEDALASNSPTNKVKLIAIADVFEDQVKDARRRFFRSRDRNNSTCPRNAASRVSTPTRS